MSTGTFNSDYEIQARRLCNPYPISLDDINRVPCKRIFDNGGKKDKLIQDIHKGILKFSMSRNNNGEVGVLLSLLDFKVKYKMSGDKTFIDSSSDTKYTNLVINSRNLSLMFLHNHPNNSGFSYADLKTFIMTPSIGVISVVCNNGCVHVLEKLENVDYAGVLYYYNKHYSRNQGVSYILDNAKRFKLWYGFGRRKS